VIGVAAEASRWRGKVRHLCTTRTQRWRTNLNEKEGLYKSDDLREAEGAVVSILPEPLLLFSSRDERRWRRQSCGGDKAPAPAAANRREL
jgi:hypothetical protein